MLSVPSSHDGSSTIIPENTYFKIFENMHSIYFPGCHLFNPQLVQSLVVNLHKQAMDYNTVNTNDLFQSMFKTTTGLIVLFRFCSTWTLFFNNMTCFCLIFSWWMKVFQYVYWNLYLGIGEYWISEFYNIIQ